MNRISQGIFLFLLAYVPFYVFFSNWAGVGFGQLEILKVSKDVLMVIGLFMSLIQAGKDKIVDLIKEKDKLLLVITIYSLLTVLMAVLKVNDIDAEQIAILFNLRFLAFFVYGAFLVINGSKNILTKASKIVLTSGIIVAILGVIQVFLLPTNALSHFGYSLSTGTPTAFFLSGESIERAFSTLKDPNSLGSYLIIIICLSFFYSLNSFYASKKKRIATNLLLLICLFLTFSRSAWIGSLVAIGTYLALDSRTKKIILKKRKVITIFTMIFSIILVFVIMLGPKQSLINEILIHHDGRSIGSSNSQRIDGFQRTVKKIIENPIGYGPGSAGPASMKNDTKGALIPENYYLQIAHEVGVFGLALFLSICFIVVRRLFLLKKRPNIAAVVIASFFGLALTNFLVQIWFNETVAYTWWGLAALVIYSYGTEQGL